MEGTERRETIERNSHDDESSDFPRTHILNIRYLIIFILLLIHFRLILLLSIDTFHLDFLSFSSFRLDLDFRLDISSGFILDNPIPWDDVDYRQDGI
jgi:hypothetical protein